MVANTFGHMLRQEDVTPLLLSRGFIKEEYVVDGGLEIINVSRRNRNFKVLSENGPCFLIKQGVGAEKIRTVTHEAGIYQFFQSTIRLKEFSQFLPRYYAYYPEECILILELVENAQSLKEFYIQNDSFPPYSGRNMGSILGIFHNITSENEIRHAYEQQFLSKLPFGLSLHHPDLNLLQYCSQASVELIKIIHQSDEFCNLLDELSRVWRAESLIHGDIRWDNLSIVSSSPSGEKMDLKVIDWELTSLGDPCWDVATVLCEYLSFWLQSAPISGESPPEEYLQFAKYPLEKMQPAIRAFWNTYTSCLHLDSDKSDEWLIRSIRYTAARLIQTAFEWVQLATQITDQAVILLQVSQNMLIRPREASIQLLGIPLP